MRGQLVDQQSLLTGRGYVQSLLDDVIGILVLHERQNVARGNGKRDHLDVANCLWQLYGAILAITTH